ncbi:MAG: BrnT family toxin [Sulfuritalea sp.]|nr:BrnT family toxin [Sulfuritalea sp.]
MALCYLDRRLHVLCFTETDSGIRVISFRKADTREARRYGKPQALD